MKTYRVPVKVITRFVLPVTEAESFDEAIEVAKEMYIMNDYDMLQQDEEVIINGEKL